VYGVDTYGPRRGGSISPLVLLVPILLILILAVVQMTRGLPAIAATTEFPATTVLGEPRQLPLPASGAALLSVEGLGTLGGSATESRRPIASVTKMMTAYVILKAHPLHPGEAGPTIPITTRDANRYLQMIAEDQSALPLSAGMTFSQYEMLQGLLIPSANNFAEILSVWDAGSLQAFVAKMNEEARALGMANTTYADASGFSALSVSTAQDQLILARAAMQNPVFAEIVSMPTVRLPGIGLVSNVNMLLGQEGVVGIKTGFTEEAGGNLAFASRRNVGGGNALALGVVLGQTNRPAAFDATRRLLSALGAGLQQVRVVSANQVVAQIDPQWSGAIDIVAAEEHQLLLWPGMTLQSTLEFDEIKAPLPAGERVGWLTLRLGEQERRVPLTLAKPLPKAGILWRLTRT
jgi:D-alanyl-D-alanine carboxypeptidase (penicillin-binding protein 5/6)